jgi:glutamine amidotransferase
MCRLYAMRANEPTRVECSLVHAQNALMRQSAGDAEGLVHGHGWGIADFNNGTPFVQRQTWAAYHGEHFSRAAARTYGHTAIAHVRRATVGGQAIENTHPFQHGRWIFAHNGTIPRFLKVRDRMIAETDPLLRNAIHGSTDSEHLFYYLLSLHLRHPAAALVDVVAQGLRRVADWSLQVAPKRRAGLNVVLTDGQWLVGARLNRTLWHLERHSMQRCGVCGKYHVHHKADAQYRMVEFASEPLSGENWRKVGEGVAFSVGPDLALSFSKVPDRPGKLD